MNSDKIKFCNIKYSSKNNSSSNNSNVLDYYNPYEIPLLGDNKYPSLNYYPNTDNKWSNYVTGLIYDPRVNNNQPAKLISPTGTYYQQIFGDNANNYVTSYGIPFNDGDTNYPDTSIMPCDLSEPFTYIINKGSCASIRLGGDILGENLEPNFIKFRGDALIGFGGDNYSFVYNVSKYSESSNNITSITVDYSKLVDFHKISKNIIQGLSQDKFDPYYIIVPPHIKYVYAYYGDADDIKPNPRNIGNINIGQLNSNDGWYRISPRNYKIGGNTLDTNIDNIKSGIFALVGTNSSDNIPNKVPSFILQISGDFEKYQIQSCFNNNKVNDIAYQVESSIYGIDNVNSSSGINWKVGDYNNNVGINGDNYLLCPPYNKKYNGLYNELIVEPVCQKTAKMYCAKRGYPVKSLSDLRKVSISSNTSNDNITNSVCDTNIQDITADNEFPGLFGASELTLNNNADNLLESFNNLTISNGDSFSKPFIKKTVYDKPEGCYINYIEQGKISDYIEKMSNNPDYLEKRVKLLDNLEKNSKNIKVNKFSDQVNNFVNSDPEFCNISYIFIILLVVLLSFVIIYMGLNITSNNTKNILKNIR